MMQHYQNKWESRSSIRTRPRKSIDFTLLGDFFPREKQILFLLPEIQSLSEQQRKERDLKNQEIKEDYLGAEIGKFKIEKSGDVVINSSVDIEWN